MLPQNWVATAKQNRTHEIPQNHTQTSTYISHPLSRYRITKRCYHRIFESPNTSNLQVTGRLMQSSHISPQLRKQYFTPIKEAVLSTNISARCRITESIKSMAISDFLATTLNKSVTTDFWGASVPSSQFYPTYGKGNWFKHREFPNSYSSRDLPALMTGLAPHLIIDALSILAIAIDKESPRSAACTQELVVLFSIYFFLGSYLYYCCFAIFRVFLFLWLSFTIAYWFHVLQP